MNFAKKMHCLVSKVSTKYNNKMLCIIWWVLSHYKEGISHHLWNSSQMLMDKINVAEWFRAKSPSLARCKKGDLPLLNFSSLTCMKKMTCQGIIIYYLCKPIQNISNWEGMGPCAIVPLIWKMAHQSLCRMVRNGPLKISKSLKKAENGPLSKISSLSLKYIGT